MIAWKPMKDGYGRTTGYLATLPDGRSIVARNTGGRRSVGNWIAEERAYGPPPAGTTRFRARACSLRSLKEMVQREVVE